MYAINPPTSMYRFEVGDLWEPQGKTRFIGWRRDERGYGPRYDFDPARTILSMEDVRTSASNSVKIAYVRSDGVVGRCGQKTFEEWVRVNRAKVTRANALSPMLGGMDQPGDAPALGGDKA